MQIYARHYLTALCLAVVMALPVCARTDSAEVSVTNPTTIAGKQLNPGTYRLEVEPGQKQLKVIDTSSDRTVAEVPCQWIQLKTAPNGTEVIVSDNQVKEIDFKGKTRAVKFD
ncbi:MAG TPA: hypothetical protein VJR26_13945 [Candidatus Acidoferrales bacterium]|nr:hypothetical protein [Candidatus Acidoferrales bacterium]